jgi:hypothetical protein
MLPPYKFKVVGTCWIWLGATITNKNGDKYGVVRVDGKLELVHRVMYQKYKGEIPPDHEVHHACLTTLCGHAIHLQSALKIANQRMKRRRRKTA